MEYAALTTPVPHTAPGPELRSLPDPVQPTFLNMSLPWPVIKCASFARTVVNMIVQNTVGDIPWLLLGTEHFITTDLYDRAADTGVAQAYLGPKKLCEAGYLPTITLVSGAAVERPKSMILQVTNYDEQDPASRQSFNVVKELAGGEPNVTLTGDTAMAGRVYIKHHLVGSDALKTAYTFTQKFIDNAFKKWDQKISVQDHITYISANILGHCVFAIPYVPMAFAKLLQEAGRVVVKPWASSKEVKSLAMRIKAMSDALLEHPDAGMLGGYPMSQIKWTGDESREEIVKKLKQLNAGADVIVEGNLSFLIVSAIVQINQNPEIKARLRAELKNFDWNQKNAHEALCQLEEMDGVYWESLRHPSPAGMLDRQVSKPKVVEGQDRSGQKVPYYIGGKTWLTPLVGNSHMVVCVSRIHHDPSRFDRPNEFDPSRFEGEKGAKLKDNIVAFSVGKRSCPAGLTDEKSFGTGFTAVVAKLTIAWFVMHYDLKLLNELKAVPDDSFYRGFNELFATITPLVPMTKETLQ